MSDQKVPRVPAGETGTDCRVDTGYGHYWVRLVTRKAIKAEGECLSNCLRWGHYDNHAGPDDLTDKALWSLRREADGVSIALAEIDDDGDLDQFKGPQNNQASATAYRQLKHLRDYLVAGGAKVNFRDLQVLVGDDGCTYRADKAPKELRDAIESKRAAERAESEARWAAMRAENDRMAGEIRARRLQALARARVDTDEPLIEATRERDGEGFWNLTLRDPARFGEQEIRHVIFASEGEPHNYAGASDRIRVVHRFRNADGTWRLVIGSAGSMPGTVPRCFFPEEGETAPAPVPAEQVPAPQQYVIGPGRVMFRHADGSEVYADVEQAPITIEDVNIARRYQSAVGLVGRREVQRAFGAPGLWSQLRNLWDLYIVDPTPTPAPRPEPDLTTRRGRTEAAMQRRQAQLADRRWVQENLREQRRARR